MPKPDLDYFKQNLGPIPEEPMREINLLRTAKISKREPLINDSMIE